MPVDRRMSGCLCACLCMCVCVYVCGDTNCTMQLDHHWWSPGLNLIDGASDQRVPAVPCSGAVSLPADQWSIRSTTTYRHRIATVLSTRHWFLLPRSAAGGGDEIKTGDVARSYPTSFDVGGFVIVIRDLLMFRLIKDWRTATGQYRVALHASAVRDVVLLYVRLSVCPSVTLAGIEWMFSGTRHGPSSIGSICCGPVACN